MADDLKSVLQNLTDSVNKLIDANRKAEEAARLSAEADAALAKEKDETKKKEDAYRQSKVKLVDSSKKFAQELLRMTDAGVKFAATIGTQATVGVRLELQNRLAAVKQIISLEANRAASLSQIQAAEQSLADTFVSVRDGLELSSDGAAQFAANLKGGFKSEFQLTNESLRALVTTGMATEAQFENFRKASGRASLSSSQFANIVNKNQLSFLLYGNSFAKAATQAERLGINLASLQSAQEGLVTNIDGTIDTVAQLNQLGAQLDFGRLIQVAEQEGPDALLAYARATIPANLLQSASTRSLFRQLGISAEDFLKSGQSQIDAANSIESQMTKAATETGMLANSVTKLNRLYNTGAVTFGVLVGSLVSTIIALNAFRGAAIGATLGKFAGPAGSIISSLLGAAIGFGVTKIATSDDMFSAGYGSRTLITPNGAFALNNADDIIAGTNLFPKGSLQAGSDTSELARKVDNLITALSNASTTINVGGTMQTVPRMQLVGVYSRNEVR